MYKIFARYTKAPEAWTPENPYAAVKEYQGTVYGFWVRPVNFCYNVSDLMKKAIDSAFSVDFFEHDSDSAEPDEMLNKVFREWTKEVTAYHEKAEKPYLPDIFKNYQFEMQVLISSPEGGLIIKTYDMDGAVDYWTNNPKKLQTDKDIVAVSLSREHDFLGKCDPRNAGILCFKDQEPTGIKNSQNRYIYNWSDLLLHIANQADKTDTPVEDYFDGSYLLAVDMNKLNNYRRYKEEGRPYITVETFDGKFAFYATPGKIRYLDMECLKGKMPSTEEYLEIIEVTDKTIKFIVQSKYLDGGKDEEAALERGKKITFGHTEYNAVTMRDGDFEFAYASKLTICWKN